MQAVFLFVCFLSGGWGVLSTSASVLGCSDLRVLPVFPIREAVVLPENLTLRDLRKCVDFVVGRIELCPSVFLPAGPET